MIPVKCLRTLGTRAKKQRRINMRILIRSVMSAVMMSGVAHAGVVTNADGSQKLTAQCETRDSTQNCTRYTITLSSQTDGAESSTTLTKISMEEVATADSLFQLDEQLNRFQVLPVSELAYDGDTRFGRVGGIGDMAMAAAPVGYVLFRYAGIAAGEYLTYAGFAVAISPVVADVTSLPARAVIYGIRWERAKRAEKFAYEALQHMMNESDSTPLTFSQGRFSRIVKAFQSVNESQTQGQFQFH